MCEIHGSTLAHIETSAEQSFINSLVENLKGNDNMYMHVFVLVNSTFLINIATMHIAFPDFLIEN